MWYAAYVVAHLLLYLAFLRRLPSFRAERTIFLYHAISAGGVTLVALGSWIAGGADFEAAVAAAALHGIYSTSFLELWSLAQGGYSLQIMKLLEEAERTDTPADVDALRAIGAAKQADRLAGLVGAGLVRQTATRVELTPFGRIVAAGFALLAWLVNLQDGV